MDMEAYDINRKRETEQWLLGPENIEAEMWRAVAKNLHDYIARIRPECSCEETPEYQEFHRNYMLVPINQRIRYYLDNHPGEEVLNACEACSVMLQYEVRADRVWEDHPDRNTIPYTKESN